MGSSKIFCLHEPPSIGFLRMAVRERGWNWEKLSKQELPKEDHFLVSKRYPIFTVSDGVTLLPNPDGTYPNPSGAGEVAKIFCEKSVEYAEKVYGSFSEKSVLDAFSYANKAIKEYNKSKERTKETINFGTFDFFHATAAFTVIKGTKLFWGTICDSLVVVRGESCEKFKSPPCHIFNRIEQSPAYAKLSSDEKVTYTHKTVRNKLDRNGNPIGYGALTGEEAAMKYVQHGTSVLEKGDLVFVLTDGFESYLDLPDFIGIFREWTTATVNEVKGVTSRKAVVSPKLFGHERTLIVVKP